MIFHKKICLFVLAASLSAFISTAEAKTILLVPQDDRPVSLDYTVSTAEKAGYTVLTPPRAYLSGKNFRGSPDQLWRCLIRQCITKAFIKIILRKAREMQSWRKDLESFLQIMAAGKSSA